MYGYIENGKNRGSVGCVMHKQRLLVIIISIIGGAGSLGEWLTFLNQTLYGYTKPDGWAAVILFGIVLITALFGGFKSSFVNIISP